MKKAGAIFIFVFLATMLLGQVRWHRMMLVNASLGVVTNTPAPPVPPAWCPTNVPGLGLWVRTNSLTNASQGAIVWWQDESGQNNHLTNWTGSGLPIASNGVPYFDGAASFFSNRTFNIPYARHTLAIVVRAASTNTLTSVFRFQVVGNYIVYPYYFVGPGHGYINDAINPVGAGLSDGVRIGEPSPAVGIVRISGTNESTWNQYGLVDSTNRTITDASTWSQSLTVGRMAASSEFFYGYIYEIVAWTNSIAESNILNLSNYFYGKYVTTNVLISSNACAFALDETSGTRADKTYYANLTAVNSPPGVAGKIGNAVQVGGPSSRYVNSTAFPMHTWPGGTVFTWYYSTNAYNDGEEHEILGSYRGLTQFAILKFVDNKIYAGWNTGVTDSRAIIAASSTTWPTTTWTQLALTWTVGGKTILWCNGAPIKTNTVNTTTGDTGAGFYLGIMGSSYTALMLNGMVDDTMLYRCDLSSEGANTNIIWNVYTNQNSSGATWPNL